MIQHRGSAIISEWICRLVAYGDSGLSASHVSDGRRRLSRIRAVFTGRCDQAFYRSRFRFALIRLTRSIVTACLNDKASPQWKVELLSRYDRYIMDEVLPLIRNECGQDAKPLTTGASLGAFLAANTYFKHPDNFRGTIAMSGSYDIRSI